MKLTKFQLGFLMDCYHKPTKASIAYPPARNLAALGLIEQSKGAWRLTAKGRTVIIELVMR